MIQALIAAWLWGCTDALAGISARRSTPLLAALWLHLSSIVLIVPSILFGGGLSAMSWRDAMFGAAAGVVAAIGDVLFGRALSKSSMTVGIPLANVIAAVIPALVALMQGAHLTAVAGMGITGALLASALAVVPSNGRLAVTGAGYAATAGICFGVMYGLLSQVHSGESLPVIFVMRIAGTLALMPGVLRKASPRLTTLGKSGLATGVLSGVASVGDNWAFVLAMSSESRLALSVVAIALASPIAVIIVNLATRERLTGVQGASAVFATLAIMLLAIPSPM
jgi:drug/metabolite transporter (DMT)-like permease